jgi:type I restriction enzyme M protein
MARDWSSDVCSSDLGGVPKAEVAAQARQLDRFGFQPDRLFVDRDDRYYDFRSDLSGPDALRALIELDPHVQHTLVEPRDHLSSWWTAAQADFARLALSDDRRVNNHNGSIAKESGGAYLTLRSAQLPKVRRTLIESLKAQLTPLGVLDDFQVAGVFVNWWDNIKYDLKTIMQNGWSPTLIPDPYLIEAFFQAEARAIEQLEADLSEAEGALEEAVEAAQAVLEYEAEEDEKIIAALMRDQLTAAISARLNYQLPR